MSFLCCDGSVILVSGIWTNRLSDVLLCDGRYMFGIQQIFSEVSDFAYRQFCLLLFRNNVKAHCISRSIYSKMLPLAPGKSQKGHFQTVNQLLRNQKNVPITIIYFMLSNNVIQYAYNKIWVATYISALRQAGLRSSGEVEDNVRSPRPI